MKLTPEVKEICALPAGRDLDRRLAKALGWKCDNCEDNLDCCLNIPEWSCRVDQIFDLRKRMGALGWDSHDDFTDRGWANGPGYSVWFYKWVKPFTGERLTSYAGSPLGLSEAPAVTARAALMALERPEDIGS